MEFTPQPGATSSERSRDRFARQRQGKSADHPGNYGRSCEAARNHPTTFGSEPATNSGPLTSARGLGGNQSHHRTEHSARSATDIDLKTPFRIGSRNPPKAARTLRNSHATER